MIDMRTLPRAGQYAMIEGNAQNALMLGKAAEHLGSVLI